MVSFYCDGCGDVIKKPKVPNHIIRCRRSYSFSCIDCNKVFKGEEFKAHTSCISEAEKYQGKLYKGPKKVFNLKI